MKMTNNEIYVNARQLLSTFKDSEQRLPVKVNFYLQKNKNTLVTLAQDIEEARMEIIRTYGTPSPENEDSYVIPVDKIDEAQKELNDLFALEQDVNIYMVNIDNLPEDLVLTTAQMEAIMFMID